MKQGGRKHVRSTLEKSHYSTQLYSCLDKQIRNSQKKGRTEDGLKALERNEVEWKAKVRGEEEPTDGVGTDS